MFFLTGADSRARTGDIWYHKPTLYQLSYIRHKNCLSTIIDVAEETRTLESGLHAIKCPNIFSFHIGGAEETRTLDPLHAMQVLYQLSYNPKRVAILYFLSRKSKLKNYLQNLKNVLEYHALYL